MSASLRMERAMVRSALTVIGKDQVDQLLAVTQAGFLGLAAEFDLLRSLMAGRKTLVEGDPGRLVTITEEEFDALVTACHRVSHAEFDITRDNPGDVIKALRKVGADALALLDGDDS